MVQNLACGYFVPMATSRTNSQSQSQVTSEIWLQELVGASGACPNHKEPTDNLEKLTLSFPLPDSTGHQVYFDVELPVFG